MKLDLPFNFASKIQTGLIIFLVGAGVGIILMKKLTPKPQQTSIETSKTETQEDVSVTDKVVTRFLDEKGRPAEKEVVHSESRKTVSSNSSTKTVAPPSSPPKKNIIGVNAYIDTEGNQKFGPMYGRLLLPNAYVTGSIILAPKGERKPAAVVGIQMSF